jgi:hypothetical protein
VNTVNCEQRNRIAHIDARTWSHACYRSHTRRHRPNRRHRRVCDFAFSVVLAVALSVGLSSFMGRLIGNMAFRTPLPLAFSSLGFGLWL